MFAFLLRFYDENSTIYMIVCCSMLLLWLYFMYMEFFPSPVDRNRLGMDSCGQQKSETRTISCDFMCKEIPWIKGEVEYYIRMHRFAKKKPRTLSSMQIKFSICTVPNECNRFSTNIATNLAKYSFTSTPLTWIGFANKPTEIRLENTGNDGNCMQIDQKFYVLFTSNNWLP